MSAALQTIELPPEAIALIQEGTPRPIRSVAPVPLMEEEESPNRARSRKERAPHERLNPIPRPVVAMTVRIAKELTDALLRLSVERRLCGEEPHTQQEMVAEAIREWLQRQGN